MKRLIYALASVMLAALFAMPMQAFAAGDTLDVAPTPVGNLNTVINSDTVSGGFRAHPDRVYRLQRGLVYTMTEPLAIQGNLHMIATDGTSRPPVLAPAILPDNSSIDHMVDLFGKASTATFTNLYMCAVRADQNVMSWSDAIRINADSVTLVLRGNVFDAFSHHAISYEGPQWAKINVQDCYFRNMQHNSSWFSGGAMRTGAPNAMDTCIFINNTFFCTNSYDWSIRGYDKHSVFEHNTLVYGVANPFLMRQAVNVTMKNNLFYAMHAMGGTPDQVWNAWFLNYPDTTSSSVIRARAKMTIPWDNQPPSGWSGPEAYIDSAHGVTADMLDPAKRVFDVENNAYLMSPPKLTAFYTMWNDTVTMRDSVQTPEGSGALYVKRILIPATWVNPFTQYTFDSVFSKESPLCRLANNIDADPGFDAAIVNHADTLVRYLGEIAVTGFGVNMWYYNPTGSQYPPVWPVPENLAYSNTSLQSAGDDGYAVGDLNWFPSQKAAWVQATDVQPVQSGIPEVYSLSQNYPNPFNPTTQITFSVPKAGNVELTVYNMLGQKVATLINGAVTAGQHSATFVSRDLASGVYFYRLVAGDYTSTMKMILMK